MKAIFAALFALVGLPEAVWAHGGGAAPGHSEQDADPAARERDAKGAHRERIASLQEKIDKLDEKLDLLEAAH